MATRFERDGVLITVAFTGDEAALLANLVSQLVELLRDDEHTRAESTDDGLAAIIGAMGSTQAPDDPVVARLLPEGYRGDEEAAADFRRFTEAGLRAGKISAADEVLEALGDTTFADQVTVELSEQQGTVWLRCLNDLRLSLGTRLEVTEDDDDRFERLDTDDPVRWTYEVYMWLGWLQESLVEAMSR
jgi:hypothetical protein